MVLYPRNFIALMDGRFGGVAAIAELPAEIGVRFSAITNVVRIHRRYVLKIIAKHQVAYTDLQYVQKAINSGYVFHGREPQYLEFIYVVDKPAYKHFLLVLKVANFGQEIWVRTFHRTDETGLRSKLRKLTIIRGHS